MPALPHPLPDSVHGKLRRRQPQEKQRDLIAEFLPQGYPTSITPSRQRRLESKSLASFHVFADPAEHHSPCGQGSPVRRQWTQSLAHQIGVHEQMTIASFAKYSIAKVVLPAPFGPAMMMILLVLAIVRKRCVRCPYKPARLTGRTSLRPAHSIREAAVIRVPCPTVPHKAHRRGAALLHPASAKMKVPRSQGSARAGQDQDCLAGSELLDGQRRADSVAVQARHRAYTSQGRKIAPLPSLRVPAPNHT